MSFLTAIRNWFSPAATPEEKALPTSPLTVQLAEFLKEWEGIDQPFLWPGENSGITIGYGFDLGQNSLADFRAAWQGILPTSQFRALVRAIGVKGKSAAAMAGQFKKIRITPVQADKVLKSWTLPKVMQMVRSIYKIDGLPTPATVALASMIYNRGTALMSDSPKGNDRYTEKRVIRDILLDYHAANPDRRPAYLQRIAEQLRSMKRLWANSPVGRGLMRRREAEAKLVESTI